MLVDRTMYYNVFWDSLSQRPFHMEDLRQLWPEPGCWPAVFVKAMVFSVSRAQKTWLWSLLFKVFLFIFDTDLFCPRFNINCSVCKGPFLFLGPGHIEFCVQQYLTAGAYAKLVGSFSINLYTNVAVSSRGCKQRISDLILRCFFRLAMITGWGVWCFIQEANI